MNTLDLHILAHTMALQAATTSAILLDISAVDRLHHFEAVRRECHKLFVLQLTTPHCSLLNPPKNTRT